MQLDNHTAKMDGLQYVSNIYPIYQKGNVKLINADCMKIMAQYPDNYFDLLFADVPYGIKADENAYKNGVNCKANGFKEHENTEWDNETPDGKYFNEARRISKNQIFFGANYYPQYLTGSMGWVFWYKMQDNFSFSDGEIIYTSFQKKTRILKYARGNESGFSPKRKTTANIHPTQKPLGVYEKLISWYGNKEMKVIDTHLGSGSSAIVGYYFGFSEFVGTEINPIIYEKRIKRFEVETMQQVLSL
jgi:site-specific DNA-methyltransferase (adenine-specific)